MRRALDVLVVTACLLGTAAGADEGDYRIVARFEERVLQTFGPFGDPAVLVAGKQSRTDGHGEAILLTKDLEVRKRIPMGREGDVRAGASANGRYIAIVERLEPRDKPLWHDANAKWELRLHDRDKDAEVSRFAVPNPVKEIQVSDNGETLLVLDIVWASPRRSGSVRCLGKDGKRLGELPGYKIGVWFLHNFQMTSDGLHVFAVKSRFDGVRVVSEFACLDRTLGERWSVDLGSADEAHFAVDEAHRRIVVCEQGREHCHLLDFDGKTLWDFDTKAHGHAHYPRISADGKTVLIRAGYRLELIDLENRRSLWVRKPPSGLRGYFVTSADVSPDGKHVVATWCQRIPGRRESMKSPRYVTLDERAGNTVLKRAFPSNGTTGWNAPEVRFAADGRSVIVREERSYGRLRLAPPPR